MNNRLIREWLRKEGMRPEELAVQLGVSFATIQKIFRGDAPNQPTIRLLAQIMGVPVSDLVDQPKQKVAVS